MSFSFFLSLSHSFSFSSEFHEPRALFAYHKSEISPLFLQFSHTHFVSHTMSWIVVTWQNACERERQKSIGPCRTIIRCDAVANIACYRMSPANVNLLPKSQALKLECWMSVRIVSPLLDVHVLECSCFLCRRAFILESSVFFCLDCDADADAVARTNEICLHKSSK